MVVNGMDQTAIGPYSTRVEPVMDYLSRARSVFSRRNPMANDRRSLHTISGYVLLILLDNSTTASDKATIEARPPPLWR